MKKAVVLFGHGARDPQWADPMRSLQAQLQQQLGEGFVVELAFLELMEPSLPDVVKSFSQGQVSNVSIIPVFFGKGGHLKRDFPVILSDLQCAYPELNIVATDAVGQWDSMWQAIANEAVNRVRG
ncbi:MAG: CbiX/SirB N-terminal domain-containing protein [Limnobacter sp.]|nr:CbiX/SirB N-terminal domain-containing protein [Limnobacter sp.]